MSTALEGFSNVGAPTTLAQGFTSLGSGNAFATEFIDNSSNRYMDVQVMGTTACSGTPTGTNIIEVYVIAAISNATSIIWTDGIVPTTGVSTAITPGNSKIFNSFLLDTITLNGTNVVTFGPWGLSSVIKGSFLPPRLAVVFWNQTNLGLSATGANHSLYYQGIYMTGQ